MKVDNYIRRSLSRQFLSILGVFTILFLVGSIVIFLAMQSTNESYYDDRAKIVEKEKVVKEINDNFNGAFFNARGYFAFNNEELKLKALAEQSTLDKLINELETRANTEKDRRFIKETREFSESYFDYVLPEIIGYYENGQKDKVAEIANSGVTANINSFQDKLKTYLSSFDVERNQRVDQLMSYQSKIQLGFVGFFLIVILILIVVITYMITNIGQPLAQFATAANEIAQGKDTLITLDAKRTDELGALFVAFKKMMVSVQEKEMDLMSHNEELIAQQDELHAQQNELEKTLDTLSRNERKLTRRNSLVNGISNSLQKCEVLNSIVVNMCEVIEADKGMIVMSQENLYASFGITEKGVDQFRANLNNGLHERLFRTKKSFTIKRKANIDEKGFHLDTQFCYDLFLPVLSSNKSIIAIMVYSRYGAPFSEEELTEYNILSKQIGISLDKIKLYEKSEEDRKLAQDILNTMQEGMLLVDSDGTIIQINDQLLKQFDHTNADGFMIGQISNDWIPFMSRNIVEKDHFVNYMRKACVEISSLDEENSLIFKNIQTDREQVLKVYGKALYRGQVRYGTVFVYRDITKEFEVDQMKSEFVSTVSHELRTPLASILGFTELMLNRELKVDRKRKYLNTIYQEAKRLTSLINEFLDIQRMESGKQLYEKKFIEIEQIIEKTIDSQQIMTNRHTISLEGSDGGNYVLGDKAKIEQVFTNLINNAIKYSPEGGTIKLKVFKNQNYVCVDITDEGLGIPADSINELFNKFFRVDNSDRRTIGGTGLGLSIVKEIMKSHNGDVLVKSQYGKGSTFTVFFPIVEGHGEHLVSYEIPANEHYCVMLVEDDYSLGELIGQELLESGFRVQLYTNGEDALHSLENDIPDAIVLDIMLESADDLDGWSIMQFLKQDARFENIPIIISSALDEMEKGYSLGATNYLIKPYKTSQLSKAIMQTLLKMGKVGQILVPQEQADQ